MSEPIAAEKYTDEPVRYSNLKVIDLTGEAAGVSEPYRNMVLNRINDSCLRLSVMEGDYRWHVHTTSDELFIVLAGCLLIDLKEGEQIRLRPLQALTVPAGTVHRTRAEGRTVTLCFEKLAAETVFLD